MPTVASAAASIAVAVGGGLCMATVGLFWEWAAPIIWPNLATERGSVHVYRGAVGLYGTHVQIGHSLVATLIITLLFGVLPSLVSSPLALSIGLLGFRCLGGLGAAVSETGCLTIISTGEAMEARAARVAVVLDVVGMSS